MYIYRTFCLLALLATLPALGAQTLTLSAKPLSEALQNSDLLLPEEDPKLADARKRVSELLLNQPTEAERDRFHKRLTLFAKHKQTRLGRLFFAALNGCPDLEQLGKDVSSAGVTATFPLALQSGARVRMAWTRKDEAMLIAEFAVEITGSAGALFAGAGPYFSSAEIEPRILNAAELDYLLGRDTGDRMKLESERSKFDFDAELARRFEIEAGAAGTLIETLAETLSSKKTPAEKIEGLLPHLESDAARNELKKQGAKLEFWDAIDKQLARLKTLPRPAGVPQRKLATVSVTRTDATGTEEWTLTRLDSGKLALRAGSIGGTGEESK